MSDELLMSELPSTVSVATADVVGLVNVKARAPEPELLARRFAAGVFSIGAAIALAGAAYPVVFASGCLIATVINSLIVGGGLKDKGESFSLLALGGTVGVGIGLVWASITGVVVLPFVYFFVRSLALRGDIVRLAAFSGGLVGFVAVLPLFLVVLFEAHHEWWQTVIIVLLGPALATVVGQIGGARGGRHVERHERAIARARVGAHGLLVETPGADSNSALLPMTAPFQFGVWHLLVISAWLSLLLTVVRLSGVNYLFATSLVVGWLVFQAAALWVVGLAARWFYRWKAGRQTRST